MFHTFLLMYANGEGQVLKKAFSNRGVEQIENGCLNSIYMFYICYLLPRCFWKHRFFIKAGGG